MCIGDYVRETQTYEGKAHSYVVINIEGDDITALECNIGGLCRINVGHYSLQSLSSNTFSQTTWTTNNYIRHCNRNRSTPHSSSSSSSSVDNESDSRTNNSESSNSMSSYSRSEYIVSTIQFTPVDNNNSCSYSLYISNQGELYRKVVQDFKPVGYTESQSVNILADGKTYTERHVGTICFKIPEDAIKPGRFFALFAVDKYGVPHIYEDLDLNDDTITVNVNYEGYAFSIIYTDNPLAHNTLSAYTNYYFTLIR